MLMGEREIELLNKLASLLAAIERIARAQERMAEAQEAVARAKGVVGKPFWETPDVKPPPLQE